jgi:hypothetical protein
LSHLKIPIILEKMSPLNFDSKIALIKLKSDKFSQPSFFYNFSKPFVSNLVRFNLTIIP